MTPGHDLWDWMHVIRNVPVWNPSDDGQKNRKILLGRIKVIGRR